MSNKEIVEAEGTDSLRKVLSRVVPMGLQDGRMYYMSDTGLLMTAQRLPCLALSSIYRHLSNPESSVYAFVQSEVDDQTPEEVQANIKTRLDESVKKCVRALQRMKDKGLYAPTVSGLRDLMGSKLPVNLGWPMDIILDMSLGLSGFETWDADIPDETWLAAIELSMYYLRREHYLSAEQAMQWGVFVGQEYETIWTFVFLLTYGQALSHDLARSQYIVDNAEATSALVTQLQSELARRENALASQEEAFVRKYESREQELEDLRIGNARLSRENEKLKLKMEMLEEALSNDTEEHDFSDADLEVGDIKADEFEYTLPETNVLFVGGHTRLQAKLKSMYPKWKFLTTKMSYSLLDDNLKSKFVFVYAGHLSHKLYYKVRETMGDTPMAFVNSQNMTLLTEEMLRAYNDYYSKLNAVTE